MGQSNPLSRSTALVVEDDDEQRFLSATLFEESDFDVIECASAEAALAVLQEKQDNVTLVFTDVALAGRMDGVDFANAVHAERPEVAVIVTSGVAGERVSDLANGVAFMPKPWRALDLLVWAERARGATKLQAR
jgi:DNA-binding NtrC family response regulator